MATARPMVLQCNSSSQVHLRLRHCTTAASSVATDYVQRLCVAGRSMSDVTSACDSRRVRMPTCALMLSAALVPTAFCAPMLQIPADHRPATLARPAGSSGAHGSSLLQRAERCSWHLLSCCGGVALTLSSRSPLSCCSMHTCMSKCLCVWFATAVLIMSVSSRTGEKPLGLALTS